MFILSNSSDVENTKLVLSKRDGSLLYNPNVTNDFNPFQKSHYHNVILTEVDDTISPTVNQWCVHLWGYNVDNKPLYEIVKVEKIGIGGIHYLSNSMCLGQHEIKDRLFHIAKISHQFGDLELLSNEIISDYVTNYNK
jgi:hypothetical protein